jgi:hypothetical protein
VNTLREFNFNGGKCVIGWKDKKVINKKENTIEDR